MAFDAISTAELSVGKPVTNPLLEKFRNRDEFLNGQVGTLSAITISNPSFEVTDTAVSGGISNWVFTPFTGGGGTVDTSTSVQGTQSIRITHPGGAGNGGGHYESDFFAVTTNAGYLIEYAVNVKGGAVPKAQVIKYNRGKSTISEVDLVGSTVVGTTGVFNKFSAGFLPSSVINNKSSVAFIKLRLVGGTTDHSTAGTVNFDNVRILEQSLSSAGNYFINTITTVNSSVVSILDSGTGVAVVSFQVKHAGGYKFAMSVGANNQRQGWAVNGTQLVGTTISGRSTFSLPNSSNTQYLKAGDVVTGYCLSLSGSTHIAGASVRVKNPSYGSVGIAPATT